jgi:cytochrome c biogenesis protein
MAVNFRSLARKTWQTAASIKTGVVLLILVVIFSAAGTVVLQRPVTEPDEMQRAYSPQALRFLDAAGLTDVFHAWWFLALMVLVSLSIIAASIERFPNAWRYFSRPYKYPDESFRRALHPQKQVPITDEETGLVAAERAARDGFQTGAGGARRPFLDFCGTEPDLGNGGLHRARQLAADFLRRDRGRDLRLAGNAQSE